MGMFQLTMDMIDSHKAFDSINPTEHCRWKRSIWSWCSKKRLSPDTHPLAPLPKNGYMRIFLELICNTKDFYLRQILISICISVWDKYLVVVSSESELTSFRCAVSVCKVCTLMNDYYRKTPSISRTKSQNLNVSCILLQLSSLNPLNPCVKLRMKM